jgi:hypothetical protein
MLSFLVITTRYKDARHCPGLTISRYLSNTERTYSTQEHYVTREAAAVTPGTIASVRSVINV